MSRGLDSERRNNAFLIKTDALVDYILISALEAVMLQAQLLFQEHRKLVGGHGVGNNSAARIIRRKDCRHHGDKSVTADFPSVGKHRAHAVNVSIKDKSQVSPVFANRRLYGLHSLFVLRIRNVVREMSVRLKELAARNIRSQRLKHLRREKSACAVSGIHNNMHTLEGLGIFTYAVADFIPEKSRVARNECAGMRSTVSGLGKNSYRTRQKLLDVRLFKTAILREKLHSVAVKGKMARRQHDRAVSLRFLEYYGHEHGRRGRKTAVKSACPCGSDCLQRLITERISRNAGIISHSNSKLTGRLSRAFLKPLHKSACNAVYHIRRKIYIFSLYTLHGHATDIASVLKLQQHFFINHSILSLFKLPEKIIP